MSGAVRELWSRQQVRAGVRIAAVAAVYWATGTAALRLALVQDQVTPLWPPTGFALACLLLRGMSCWPGIMIGAFLANLPVGPDLLGVLIIAVGNTAGPVVACLLLHRFGFRVELDRLRDAVALVFLAALGAMLVSSMIGAATLWLSGSLRPGEFWLAWSVWWAGDAMGVLTVTPVLLMASGLPPPWRWRARPVRWLEAAGVPVAAIGVMAIAEKSQTPMFFLVFPVLIWAAVRFQIRGATPCALVVSITTSVAAVRGRGPFEDVGLMGQMIILHAFNAATALTALLLAVITIERMQALRAVERAVAQLSDAVAALEPYRLLRGGVLDGALHARFTDEQR